MFWMIMAGAAGALAVFFVFTENYESAFIAAALGAVFWFLNYRQQLRESLPDEDEEGEEEKESDEETRF
jgi:hypothetical protein